MNTPSRLIGDDRYEMLVQLSPDALYVMQEGRLVFINMAGARLLNAESPQSLIGLSLKELVHPDFAARAEARIQAMIATGQQAPTMAQKYMRRDGSSVDVEVCSAPFLYGGKPAIQVLARDITARKAAEEALHVSEERHRLVALEATRAKDSLHHEKIILEMIALNEPLEDILREVCLGIEWIIGQICCSIVLLEPDGKRLRVGAAPSLPNDYIRFLGELNIGPDATCCGAAIFHNKQILVEDIAEDPVWEKHKARALTHGLHACWSTPIRAASGAVLGALGVYYSEPQLPAAEDRAFIGNITHLVGVAIQKDQIERSLHESEERYRSVVNCLNEGILVQSRDGIILACNPSAARILRIDAEHAVGRRARFARRIVAEDGTEFKPDQLPTEIVSRTGQPILEHVAGLEMQDGDMVWVSQNILPIRQPGQHDSDAILMSFTDISAVKEAQQRLQYLATHDSLTGLPNRAFLVERLTHSLSLAHRNQHRVAVMFLDLDRFKHVNDTIGHEAGDEVLRTVASRLSDCIRDTDTLARLGGDEFVILAEGFDDPGYLTSLAERILRTIAEPFRLQGYEYYLGVSIGISVHPDDGNDGNTLLRCADSAMYSAKESGRNHYQFYTQEMNARTQRRYHLEKNLRHALTNHEFVLHYQPKIELKTGQIVGAEALLRWNNPDAGLVGPEEFVPLAEETGLIVPIGRWALEQACRQAAEWRARLLPDMRMAVNLSPRQFHDEYLLNIITDILGRCHLPANVLELEITESLLMSDTEKIMPLFDALSQLGITFSLDDFGTGYSSLSYLQRFPIKNIKIDRSFIKDIPGKRDSVALTQTIIAMAHSLSMKVTAEGVEQECQMEFLRDAGCHEMQGFYFSKPVPAEEFEAQFLVKA